MYTEILTHCKFYTLCFHSVQMGGSTSTIVANDWDYAVYAKVENERCLVEAEFSQASFSANANVHGMGFGIGVTKASGRKYMHYTKIPGLTKIAPNTMTTFESEKGEPIYVTIVTAHSNDPIITRNFRHNTGNVMLIKEDGTLAAINGQNVEEIQEVLDD